MGRRRTFPLSERLLSELDRTARGFARRGVHLFVFGSIAETFPSGFRGADLDLGYTISDPEADRSELEQELARAIEQLPTIRPIDLVNFDAAGEDFRRIAGARIVRLPVSES